jgi:hypothetical protein
LQLDTVAFGVRQARRELALHRNAMGRSG